jgi:hypothetical protein
MMAFGSNGNEVRFMKTKMFWLVVLGIAPFFSGCAQANSAVEEKANPPAAVTNVATPESAAAALLPAAPATPATNVPIGQVINPTPVFPATLKLTAAAGEIAKLAQAGVNVGVMLASVTNSPSTFNLGADEIVYLNDLGVAPEVMTAMIQHDQQLREASQPVAVAAAAPTTSVWTSAAPVQSNVWQQTVTEPAPVAAVETVAAVPPPEQPPTEVTVNHFYDSLAPYGTWIDIPGYGRCWRPTIAVTVNGWRPYEHGGRWIWTDAGWYWYSDYSWGWAPFHYGRWFAHSSWGWCWVPDTVWGPSWVSWRYSDAYCGWAPLPPAAYYVPGVGFTYYGSSVGVNFGFGLTWSHYTFVSYNHFHSRHYDRHCVPRHEVPRVARNTTVVNNIITGDNNVIINQGIAPDRITAVTRTEIPRVQIRDTAGAGTGNVRGGRNETLTPDGRTLHTTRNVIPGTPVNGPGRNPRTSTTAGTATSPTATPSLASPLAPSGPGRNENIRGNPPGSSAAPSSGPTSTAFAPAPTTSPAPAPTSGVAGNDRQETPRGGPRLAPVRETPAPTSSPTKVVNTRGENTGRGSSTLIIRSGNNPSTTPAAPNPVNPPVASVSPTPNAPVRGNSSATPWLNQTPATQTPAANNNPRVVNPRVVRDDDPPRSTTIIRQTPAMNAPAAQTVTPSTPRILQAPPTPRVETAPPRILSAPNSSMPVQNGSSRYNAPVQPTPRTVAPALEVRSAPSQPSVAPTRSAPQPRSDPAPRSNSSRSREDR